LGVFVVVKRQGHLLEVVLAAHAVGSLADLLHGGQQQTDEYRDDSNHDKQLDQGKGLMDAAHGNLLHSMQPRRAARGAEDGPD
jgi:hypothetical protein